MDLKPRIDYTVKLCLDSSPSNDTKSSASPSLCCLVVIYTNIRGKLKLQAQREFAYSQMVIKPSFLHSGGEKGS